MSDVKKKKAPNEPPPSYEATANGTPLKPIPLRAPLPLHLPFLDVIRGKRIILASASPRRRQLLAQIGLTNLEIIPSTVPENFPKSLSPFEYVLATASQKATTVYAAEIDNETLGEPAVVIAADTVVVSATGQILEKPQSEAEHISTLRNLRDGGAHKVFTAVAVMAPLESAREPGYAFETAVEETTVRFDKNIPDETILAYVKTREGADKAGGYGIQGIGTILVERIEGSFDNIVGLPVRTTLGLIEKVLSGGDGDEGDDGFEGAFEDE